MAGSLARLRLAWRDLWAQGRRSIFFALLVAAGVASLVGVQGMARSLEASMYENARQMVQGDLLINRSKPLTAEQQEAVDGLVEEGAQITETVQINGHVKNKDGHAMIEVKLVDQAVWPFYGGFRSSPESVKLGKGEALVAPELLTTLKLKVGESFDIGEGQTYQIVGTVLQEPRPLNGMVPIGPRVLIARESWSQEVPSSAVQQILVKLPAGLSAAHAKEHLVAQFPEEGTIATAEEAWKALDEVMDQVFTFLSMVALISLLVGGLGVAMAMRTFISQKLEHIAVLKALGASSGTVISVFLLEAAMLGLGGSSVGAGLGLGVQILLPKLFEGLVPTGPVELNWPAALSGLAAGVAIAVLSALVPVRAIRAIKPVALLRGETAGNKMGWKAWVELLLTGLVTLAGIAWMAVTYAKSTTVGLGFLGGLILTTALLFLVAWLLLKVVKLLPQSGRPAARHAVRSLHAPGNQSASVVVAMGLGIMLMTLVYLIQSGLLQQLKTVGIGPETPNLYIVSHNPEGRADALKLLQEHSKVTKVHDSALATGGELIAVDGVSQADKEGKFPVEGILESPTTMPKDVVMVEGEWFTAADTGKLEIAIMDRVAQTYNLKVGSSVTFKLKDQETTFTVRSIYRLSESAMMAMAGNIGTAPGTLEAFADQYMLTATTDPGQEERVMGDLLDKHPEAMPISLGTYLRLVEDLLNRVANILRFLTAFAVVAAGVILSGSLSATRFRRRKEAALLKSLGASRLTVATTSALENGLLGIVAGLAGAGMAYLIVQGAGAALKMDLFLSFGPLWLATLAGGLLAVLVGVGATLDVLQVKPLTVLRSE